MLAILLPLQVPLPFEKRRNLIRLKFASGSSKVQPVTKNESLRDLHHFTEVANTSAVRKHVCLGTFYRQRNQGIQPDVHQGASPPPLFLLVNIFQIGRRIFAHGMPTFITLESTKFSNTFDIFPLLHSRVTAAFAGLELLERHMTVNWLQV